MKLIQNTDGIDGRSVDIWRGEGRFKSNINWLKWRYASVLVDVCEAIGVESDERRCQTGQEKS